MNRVLDKLRDDLESISAQPELIHNESFMMGLMDQWADQIPDFKEYLFKQFNVIKQRRVNELNLWAVPLREVRKELFYPVDQDNKESTPLLEKLAKIACIAWVEDMMDRKKATYSLLSVSGGKLSYEHCPEDLRKSMWGMMAVNDLAESAFAGVTEQLQCYGRIGLTNAAAVSDMSRNKFLSRDHNLERQGNEGMFHRFPDELQITSVMTAMKFAPETRESNNGNLKAQKKDATLKQDLRKKVGFENAKDEYIECLIHHKLGESGRCWKTVKQVRDGLKMIEYKCDKEAVLKDNINIRFKGYGWADCKVAWSKDGKKKTVPELKDELIDIIKKTKGREIPDHPPTNIPRRKNTSVLGTMSIFQKRRDELKSAQINEHDQACRKEWKDREASGRGSMLSEMQMPGKKRWLDSSFVDRRIEYLTAYDITNDDGTPGTELRWCSALVESVSDGSWAKAEKMEKD